MAPAPKAPRGGGATALWMAQRRAEEQARPDRLFEDPFAAAFVAAAGKAAPPPWARAEVMQDYFAVRTRFIDDRLLDAAAAGCRDVVVLGAGLDARAHRLAWPDGVRVFEIDLGDVLAFKREVLAGLRAEPRAIRVEVAVDLRDDWPGALRAAGLGAGAQVAFLAEGILMYLTQPDADGLVARVAGLSPPGSRLIVEHRRFEMPTWREALAAVPLQIALALLGSSWKSSVRDPVAWLRAHGYAATAPDPGEIARGYGRTVLPLAKAWLIDAVRT